MSVRRDATFARHSTSIVSIGQYGQNPSGATVGRRDNIGDSGLWRCVLNQDDLASFRLNVRSDVVELWEVASTTYNNFYCQVKISKTKETHLGLKANEGRILIEQTRVLLLPPSLSMLTREAFYRLRRDNSPVTGAANADRESQSRIFKTEAPQFVGAGEGTDNLDFLADLSALKVIDPDSISKASSPGDVLVPNSLSILLEKLMQESIPYSHCAWCDETPKTRSMLEEHYYEIHHVVLQPSCCAPPSVFQTIMGMELQLRQANFGSYSQGRVLLRI